MGLLPMQVFISYARADEDFAKALSSQLTKRGLSVWNADDEVLESIANALKQPA